MNRQKKTVSPPNNNPEFRPEQIKIIAGLGNPGAAYGVTYHNAGFLAVNYLAGELPETEWRRGRNFLYLKTGKLIFVKPAVLMNESGEALKQALRYFKTKSQHLLIIHDDSDIGLGNYKIGFGRGAAGHWGVTSAINHLKTKDFWRARVGVRNRRGKAKDFVLKKITRGDMEILRAVFQNLKTILSPSGSD